MSNTELGQFSIAGDPPDVFSVTIKYPDSGQILVEALVPRKTIVTKGLWRSGLSLIGKTQTTAKVTLLSCRVLGIRTSALEDILTLMPRWLIKGLHVENPDEAIFQAIEMRPRFLGSWFGPTLITTTPDLDTGATTISHPGKLEKRYTTSAGTLSVGRKISEFTMTFDHRAQSMKEVFWCRLDFGQPKDFGDVLSLISTLEAFFSFSTMQTARATYLGIRSSNTEIGQLIFGQTSNDGALDDEDAHNEILFGYDDILENLGQVFDRWLSAQAKIEACQQLLTFARNPNTNLENQLVALCQGLESFHRKSGHGAYVPKEKYLAELYPKIVSAIPEGMAPSHVAALKSRIKYGYEYSLRKRLTDILDHNGAELKSFIRNAPEVVKFAVDERNAYTHLDRDTPKLEPMSVIALCFCLELLLTACILEELGIPEERRKNIFDRNQNYLRLRSRLVTSFTVPGS